MNFTLFGANGTIGKLLTRIVLENGDQVTAYVRKMTPSSPINKNIEVIEGELTNIVLIEKAISKADVVISTLGPTFDTSRLLKGTPIANGMYNIINVMELQKKKRLVILGTPVITAYEDEPYMSTKIPVLVTKYIFPNVYLEMKRMEQLITVSKLDWTVVRIIKLVECNRFFDYDVSLGDEPARTAVSRDNVASFMYHIAKDHSYIYKMPLVFNR